MTSNYPKRRQGTGPANTWPEMSGACVASSTKYFLQLHFSHLHFSLWLLQMHMMTPMCDITQEWLIKLFTSCCGLNDCLLNPSPGLRLSNHSLATVCRQALDFSFKRCAQGCSKIQSLKRGVFLILSKNKNTRIKVFSALM